MLFTTEMHRVFPEEQPFVWQSWSNTYTRAFFTLIFGFFLDYTRRKITWRGKFAGWFCLFFYFLSGTPSKGKVQICFPSHRSGAEPCTGSAPSPLPRGTWPWSPSLRPELLLDLGQPSSSPAPQGHLPGKSLSELTSTRQQNSVPQIYVDSQSSHQEKLLLHKVNYYFSFFFSLTNFWMRRKSALNSESQTYANKDEHHRKPVSHFKWTLVS